MLSTSAGTRYPLGGTDYMLERLIVVIVILAVIGTAAAEGPDMKAEQWGYELLIVATAAMIGGVFGLIGGLVSTYWGPRRLEEWRLDRHEQRHNGPRKNLLCKMLQDNRWPDRRTMETLSRGTGTSPDECRRLLIEIEARGVKLKGNVEGWALMSRKPLDDQ